MTTENQPTPPQGAPAKVTPSEEDIRCWKLAKETWIADEVEAGSDLSAARVIAAHVARTVAKAVDEVIRENDEEHARHADWCQKEMAKACEAIRATRNWDQNVWPSPHDRVWVAAAIAAERANTEARVREACEPLVEALEKIGNSDENTYLVTIAETALSAYRQRRGETKGGGA
jgi:predicted lipoprotein